MAKVLKSLKGATLYWKEQIDTDFIDNNTFSVEKDILIEGSMKAFVNNNDGTDILYFSLNPSSGDYYIEANDDGDGNISACHYSKSNSQWFVAFAPVNPVVYQNFDFPDINEDPTFIQFVLKNTTNIEGGVWERTPVDFKSPLVLMLGEPMSTKFYDYDLRVNAEDVEVIDNV